MIPSAFPDLPAPMQEALALAAESVGHTTPNPAVGCVITAADGRVIGRGRTQPAGQAHAEVMALRDAQARGEDVRGATAWVTLEPCAHTGRTGPCCDALVAAGIARVVASLADPHPQVAGQGFARLRAAGVAVEVGPGQAQAREINLGFLSRIVRGRPWVRVKVAASLDGITALADGQSQWITSEAARADGHAWRARACAILTGSGTVRQDDPRLDVRLAPTRRQPRLVVVDGRLSMAPTARLFGMAGDSDSGASPGQPAGREVRVYGAQDDARRRAALEARGALVRLLPERTDGPPASPGRVGSPEAGASGGSPGTAVSAGANGMHARVDLAAMLQDLALAGINEVHVEAGRHLNGALARAGLIDEWLVYLAPCLLGPGRGLASLEPLARLSYGLALEFKACTPVGPDLRILARTRGADRF